MKNFEVQGAVSKMLIMLLVSSLKGSAAPDSLL